MKIFDIFEINNLDKCTDKYQPTYEAFSLWSAFVISKKKVFDETFYFGSLIEINQLIFK